MLSYVIPFAVCISLALIRWLSGNSENAGHV